MPQIAQIGEIYASQLFWLAIFFGAIFVVIGLGMLPKIQSTVDARDAKIAADLEAARGARPPPTALKKAIAREMDKSRAEAARLAAEAKAEAAKATEQSVATADAAIGGRLDAAMARIGEARAAALAEIESVAAEATEATGQPRVGADDRCRRRRAPRLPRNWSMAEPEIVNETALGAEVPGTRMAPPTRRRSASTRRCRSRWRWSSC